jgi:K+-transporting ATPase KdpF subunit
VWNALRGGEPPMWLLILAAALFLYLGYVLLYPEKF